MAKRLLIVVAVAVVCAIIASLIWGRLVGVGAGAFLAIMGAIIMVLRRNQKDLHELEHGHVPEPVDRALGEKHRPSPDGPAADSSWP
jgi:hypothetical protein